MVLAALVPSGMRAQIAADPRCDSVVANARVDSTPSAMFISIKRTDGGEWIGNEEFQLLTTIAGVFAPPIPFRLNVFAGGAVTRSLRVRGADTVSELRAPTVTGVYRVIADASGTVKSIRIARVSLMPGFDSAAVSAIEQAAMIKQLFKPEGDSLRIEVRFSTDSTLGARRLFSATFPRFRVVDARPLPNNPAPVFPDSERIGGATSGEIVVRFVVNRLGEPIFETIEIVRGTSLAFAREALTVLAAQRFTPATIHGCAVAQRIDYPFTFVAPEDSTRPPRH